MDTKTLISAEEFEAVAERLGPCELVRGEVITLSPAGFPHNLVTANVTALLWNWARLSRLGRVFGGEAGLVVETDPDTVRGADVAYYSYERLPKGAEPQGFCTTPANLVVEGMGKGQGWREMVEKTGEYLRMGVDRLWVVEPQTRRVHVFRPDAEPEVLNTTDTMADETTLPGFSCQVADFFAA